MLHHLTTSALSLHACVKMLYLVNSVKTSFLTSLNRSAQHSKLSLETALIVICVPAVLVFFICCHMAV